MADSKNDITTSIDASDADVLDLKKTHYQQAGSQLGKATRMAPPVNDIAHSLRPELLNMLKIGKNFSQFQGIDRCIRIIDMGKSTQHHCLATMVNNLSTNQKVCTSCDRIKDVNANPIVINSSMIRLSDKELKECGLEHDPLFNVKSEPIKQPKQLKNKDVETSQPRRTKVKTPNSVKIEMTMEDLKKNPNVLVVMLQKTLDAIYELPVSNFREAEEIRVVKERVESFLPKV